LNQFVDKYVVVETRNHTPNNGYKFISFESEASDTEHNDMDPKKGSWVNTIWM